MPRMPSVWFFPKHLLNWASFLIFPDLRRRRLGPLSRTSPLHMWETWNPETSSKIGSLLLYLVLQYVQYVYHQHYLGT